jgi:VanZ family protein
MVFVTLFSLFSFSGVDSSGLHIPHLDKAVHFTFYFVMVVLAFLAKSEGKPKEEGRPNWLVYIVLFAICYGIIIEILQHVATANREGDLLDALANSIGAISGMMLIRYLFSRKRSLK